MVNPGCSSYLGCRAPSIPEGQDLSRSSSNDSSLASVVEENETETTEDYDTGMVSTDHVPASAHTLRGSLLCALSRRVCHLLGRHTSETPSPTAPGWRTAAAPAPSAAVTPQVRQMWYLEPSFLLQGIQKHLPSVFMHPKNDCSSGLGKLERGKGTDIRIKLERPQDHHSSSVSL